MPAYGILRTTPVSGAGVVREAYFEAVNTDIYINTAGVRLSFFDSVAYQTKETPIHSENIPARATRTIFSAKLTSTGPGQTFTDRGGRL